MMANFKYAFCALLAAVFFTVSFSAFGKTNVQSDSPIATNAAPLVYVVNFTADWCPNCRVLDPRLAEAMAELKGAPVEQVTLDMTDGTTRGESFEKVNGTLLAGAYGDHVGVTGLVIMVAADSGEKLTCATRLMTAGVIRETIEQAVEQVRREQAGSRTNDSLLCPPANRKIRVD